MNIEQFYEEWNNDSELIEVQTSGSTGKPQKMLVKKTLMLASACRTNDFFGLRSNDRALLCMSLDYIAGKMMAVRAIERGLQLDVVEPCGNPLAQCKGRYDFVAMVPMQVWNTLHCDDTRQRITDIDNLLIGGGSINNDIERELSAVSCRAWSSYGMTETLSHIALRRVGKSQWYEPLRGVSLSISEDGCLVVTDKTTETFNMKTNDMAEFSPDGRLFRILGRKDNVICSGGIKIHAEEVERLVAAVFSRPFMITKCPDEQFGEAVVMVIEGYGDAIIGKARAVCAEVLPKYWQPRQYVVVDKLPRTATLKVRRVGLDALDIKKLG
ncbi:MAG: AMP-binding protein [Prevotella sp.]|uniref:AMP-binding protein n=1 Tax=Prevotella sp. TaxID=59823 RepID=UPI002A32708E|nr:AMP-binding protein [Prevotella sp.]MDD7318180.1 AMP-binding protein [Prevotellaceae bacterium]MDY4020931.1 AMP-binding protein [Prevotella sp.]